MHVYDIRFHSLNGQGELSAMIRPARHHDCAKRVWFRFPASEIPPNPGDVMLCALLVPCMQAGEDLDIAAPVSPGLMAAVPGIQDRMLAWYPSFRHARVRAPAGEITWNGNPRTAACFSGGVDSIYTALDPDLEADALVLVHGFENPAHRLDLLRTTRDAVEPAARFLGKEVMLVSTNLRSLADRGQPRWGPRFNGRFFGFCWMGSFLAAVGHCLKGRFNRFVIPASMSLDALHPYGSHPHLDPLWSSEGLRIIHHGAGADRIRKIRHIVETSVEMVQWMQVCESNPPGETNCGTCDKCLRTRLALHLAGAGRDFPTSHGPPRWSRWPRVADPARWRSEYAVLRQWSLENREKEAAAALRAILFPRPGWRDLVHRGRNLAKSLVWRWTPSMAERLRGRRSRGW